MQFRLLGPLEALDGDRAIGLGGAKQRALLTLLLLDVRRTVSNDRLVDELWGADAPESARKMVQIYVSNLRKVLPDGMLRTWPAGYSLDVEPGATDLGRFERMAAEGRGALAAGALDAAAAALRSALALWRGSALEEFGEPFAVRERARLESLRIAALEDRIEADLARGAHADVTAELDALVLRHPERERLRGQHMLALYRSGRQAEALASYQAAWRHLGEQLGIQPSSELRALEQRILAQDPALAAAPQAAPASAAPLPAPQPDRSVRYAVNGDVSLAYQVFGRGPAELVLVTGWCCPWSCSGTTQGSPPTSTAWAHQHAFSSGTSAGRASLIGSGPPRFRRWKSGWAICAPSWTRPALRAPSSSGSQKAPIWPSSWRRPTPSASGHWACTAAGRGRSGRLITPGARRSKGMSD